jgi:hypothetical protein
MQVFFSIFWWIYFCIFFSGYPPVYIFFNLLAKNKNARHFTTEKILPLLPLTYAFAAAFFWLLMLYTGRMSFVVGRIFSVAPSTLVIFYSFSALVFWLPPLRRKPNWSLLHSMPLFILPFINMLLKRYRHKIVDHDYIISLVKIYTAGIIVYIMAIIFLLAIKWLLMRVTLLRQLKKNKSETVRN